MQNCPTNLRTKRNPRCSRTTPHPQVNLTASTEHVEVRASVYSAEARAETPPAAPCPPCLPIAPARPANGTQPRLKRAEERSRPSDASDTSRGSQLAAGPQRDSPRTLLRHPLDGHRTSRRPYIIHRATPPSPPDSTRETRIKTKSGPPCTPIPAWKGNCSSKNTPIENPKPQP